MTRMINEQVTVTCLGFKKNLVAYPRRIEYKGSVYEFIDAGLSCLVTTGGKMAQIVTLSDGNAFYRLRSDNHGGNWTLLSISA